MQRPSGQPRGGSAATRMKQPCSAVLGTWIGKWHVKRELLGPQCGRSLVPGDSTLKMTSPPPQSARPVASRQWVCKIRTVSGNCSAYSRCNAQLVNKGTSRQRPDFRSPPSCNAPARLPTSPRPGVVSESSQSFLPASLAMYASYSPRIVSKLAFSFRHISKSSGLCHALATNEGTKCGGRCHLLYQMPFLTACAASCCTSSYQPEGSFRSRQPMRLM
mmetsp:Transcript_63345/g.182264  ORF Transcript_63345/g.182264 Transcript_63345/m.182264 type:complete len:218 (-) Transcript_63345:1429-2082(-)